MREVYIVGSVAIAANPREQSQDRSLHDAITGLIQSLLKRDDRGAFARTSLALHLTAGSAEEFGRLVTLAFPMLRNPRKISFMAQHSRGLGRLQHVLIADAGGSVHPLAFAMMRSKGEWRVSGIYSPEDLKLEDAEAAYALRLAALPRAVV